MYISYLPDEMKISFKDALKLGAEMEIGCIEVRAVDGVNCIDLNDDQVEAAKRLLERYGMKVSALATPFFKCTMPGIDHKASGPMHAAREMSYEEHLNLIARGAQIAKAFGTDKMRLFTFWRREGVDFWPALNEAVKEAVARVAGTGVRLAVENEGACMIGTTKDLAEAAQKLEADVGFIYDPGNSARLGFAPRSEDLEAIGDRIALVHVKDGHREAGAQSSTADLIGEGAVNWVQELAQVATKYDGPLTLEPHYAPGGDTVKGMRDSITSLRRIAKESGVKLD